jgi:hypothetical protein
MKPGVYSMTTVMPEGEAIRRAIKWISGKRQEDPKKLIQILVNDAVSRFDLSPKEAEFLTEFYLKGKMEGH